MPPWRDEVDALLTVQPPSQKAFKVRGREQAGQNGVASRQCLAPPLLRQDSGHGRTSQQDPSVDRRFRVVRLSR